VGHRVEKLTGGGEALDGITLRLDQAMERPTDRGVVVDDGDERCADHKEYLS
jgi:hypothetical protein